MASLRVGFYQFRPLFGKPGHNTDTIVHALERAQADLIVLPELALSGYYFRDAGEAMALAEEPGHSPHLDALADLCRRRDMHMVVGFAEKCGARCFNSAALISPAGLLHVYRKLHLFGEEKRALSPGDIPLQVQEVCGARLGIMICFDWAFPEVARCLALRGAQLLCHPSNLVLGHCQKTMLARCLENRVYAVTANRFGTEKRPHGRLRFTGRSQIVAPDGALVHQAPAQREMLHVAEIDLDKADDKMLTPHNDVFQDRRREFYGALTEEGGRRQSGRRV